jgi:hypothetical protein
MQGQGLGAFQRALRDPADPHPEGICPFRELLLLRYQDQNYSIYWIRGDFA